MSASAPDASGAHHHAAGFSSRAAAVFGALSAPSAQPAWALSEETVFRAGKAADYSSDEEVQAAVAEKWREETLPRDLLDLSGEGAAATMKPSVAFCQALDNEEEFDEADAIAAGRRSGEGEQMPHLATEVLEDNAYERRSQAQSAGEAMEVEEPDDEQPTPQLQQAPVHVAARVAANGVARMAARRAGPIAPAAQVAEASGEDEEEAVRSKARKRVRFQDDVAAVAPAERGELDGRAAQGARRRPQRGMRGSYVPDHVRNPGKYTCYALEEPLIIGSGGGGGDALGDTGQVQAARAAQAAAQAMREPQGAEGTEGTGPPPSADLPAFGKGIAFVPRSRRGTAAGSTSSGGAANGSASGEEAATGRAESGAEGGTEGIAQRGGGGWAAGAAGVDRSGGGQGVMALDGGLAAEDEAEEVAMNTGAPVADQAPALAVRRRVFRGHKPVPSGDSS